MIWELFLGMFLIIGFATLFVYSVEIYEWFCTKVLKWLQNDKWFYMLIDLTLSIFYVIMIYMIPIIMLWWFNND